MNETSEAEIAAVSTAPRVTMADITANIAAEYLTTADKAFEGCPMMPSMPLLTICVIVLKNGFTVTGTSACASPQNFDAVIGQRIAREDAIRQIWPLMGYALKQQLHDRAQQGCATGTPTRPDSHASKVLYPAIEAAMKELDELPATFNFTVNRAFNILHGAFWSECPAPASAAPLRTAPV